MRKNIDKLIKDLEKGSKGLDNIQFNLQNLDYSLSKIVYLKSHAINMIFKDAVVLKKEPLDEGTIEKGMNSLRTLVSGAVQVLVKQGGV